MAKPQQPQANLRRRRQGGQSRGPLGVVVSFGILLAASWPVSAIADRDHGRDGDGRRSSRQGDDAGKRASGKRSGGGDSDGERSDSHRSTRGVGHRRGRGRGHHKGGETPSDPQPGPGAGGGGDDGGDRGGGKRRKEKRAKRERSRASAPAPATPEPSPRRVALPVTPVPAPAAPGPAAPAPVSTPGAETPAAPAPTAESPAPSLPEPVAGELPGPAAGVTPEDGSSSVVPGLGQPGAFRAGTILGATEISGAAALGEDGDGASGGGATRSGGSTGSSDPGGDDTSGVGSVVRQGAREVVEVVPAYMWAATSTLLLATLLLAGASWVLAGRARALGRPGGKAAATGAAAAAVPLATAAAAGTRIAPAPAPADLRLLEGDVSLDVGPFPDMDALADFERELARLPLVQDVRVGHFEGDRVLINLRLAGPTDFAHELRQGVGDVVAVASYGPNDLVVDIAPRGA
jgi:hypothetical protein